VSGGTVTAIQVIVPTKAHLSSESGRRCPGSLVRRQGMIDALA